jgi:hypothetical protein
MSPGPILLDMCGDGMGVNIMTIFRQYCARLFFLFFFLGMWEGC